MMPPSLRILAIALAFTLHTPAQAVEILHWERLPLAIPLVVNQERVVFMDRDIRVGVPASIGDRLRVQSAGGAIYLRASASIEPTRLQLHDADTGAVILIDITAELAQADQVPLEPVQIIEPGAAYTPLDDPNAASTGDKTSPHATAVPVLLTRYAAQNIYAPLRTVEPVSGITRVSLRRNLPLDTLLPTLPIESKALVAWRLDNTWVTAVRLRNRSMRWLDLDPRTLQGNIATATFQHPDLGPIDTPEDTTVVYLITRGHDLAKALLPALSPVDAASNLPQLEAQNSHQGDADAQ